MTVESSNIRPQAGSASSSTPTIALPDACPGQWLTVLYRNVERGAEVRAIGEHPKVSALSWSNVLDAREKLIHLFTSPLDPATVAKTMEAIRCDRSGTWLTVVYRKVEAGEEYQALIEHPKVAGFIGRHALDDRNYLQDRIQEAMPDWNVAAGLPHPLSGRNVS